MLKTLDPAKIEQQAVEGMSSLFSAVPIIEVGETVIEPSGQDRGIDFIMHIKAGGRPYTLVCEIKNTGQPRAAREAIMQLRNYTMHHHKSSTPVFIAPYISHEVRDLCRDNDINYYDLHGNYRFALTNLFIERIAADKPPAERRELKSLFKPKSARVLRFLIRSPHQPFRLGLIADETKISIGQVHNVKEALVAREWASAGPDGLSLTNPDAVLDAWRDEYSPPQGEAHSFYTPLHGKQFEVALRDALRKANEVGQAALSSFSAADWLAPYVRHETQTLYATSEGLQALVTALDLGPAPRGANVMITSLVDEGPLLDAEEPLPGLRVTSPTQTYLDLSVSGERGREAAEHLRREKLFHG